MSDEQQRRDGMRDASDLWPRRRDGTEGDVASPTDRDRGGSESLPGAGASDLRPPLHEDIPFRREARTEATVRDQAQSGDLRPAPRGGDPHARARADDLIPTRRPVAPIDGSGMASDGAGKRSAMPVEDIRARVERIQRDTGQEIGERRPPVTGPPVPAPPPYVPPPYSAPQPARPTAPDSRPPVRHGPNEPDPRPPLGAYPPNSPSPTIPTAPTEPGTAPPPTGQPSGDPRGNDWQRGGPTWGPPPGQQPGPQGWGGQTNQPPWGPPPGQQPWSGPQPWAGPPGPGGPPWSGQWGPGGPPAWTTAPAAPPARRGGSGKAPWGFWDILAIVGITIAAFFILSFVAIFALEGAGRDLDDLSDPLVLLALAVPQSIGIALGVWLILIVRRNLTWKDLGFRRAPMSAFLWMLPLTIVLLILVAIVGALQNFLFDIEAPEGGGLPIDTADISGGTIFAIVIIAVILAPITEELLFRGVLFQYLRSRYLMVARGLFEAVVLSALGFALLHLGGSILPILPLGIILALVMHRWNSLWPPIFLHFLYNSLVVLVLLLTL